MPASADAVEQHIAAHAPEGTSVFASGTGTNPETWSVTFAFPRIPDVLGQRLLALIVTPTGDGQSAVRADAWVTWWLPRPAGERVPA